MKDECNVQGRTHEFTFGGPEPMASAERAPITGLWGRSLHRGPGVEAVARGQGGEAPLQPTAFYLSEILRKPQNASFGVFWKWKPTKIHVSTMS